MFDFKQLLVNSGSIVQWYEVSSRNTERLQTVRFLKGRPGQTRHFAKEKEKEEKFWKVEKKNRKGKGGKYVEKQKVMLEENTEFFS